MTKPLHEVVRKTNEKNMGYRFDRCKVRKSIEAVILKTANQIRSAEKDLQDSQASLRLARADVNTNRIALKLLEHSVSGMQTNITEMKQKHEQFVREQGQPSAAFPSGIASCQELAQ